MDPEKIRAIRIGLTLLVAVTLGPFFRLDGYYRKFIENFSRIACSMMALQKKGNKLLWTDKCEESLQKLKQLLITAPILQIVDPDGDFIVCMDARKEGIRGILL